MPRFFSLSSHPGRTGTWFYSRFFHKHGLDHSYHAIGATNIGNAWKYLKEQEDLGGISISMPFKKSVIPFLDQVHGLARLHGMCNTVVPVGNQMVGYNCDHAGAMHLASMINQGEKVSILGNGAIGSMIEKVMEGGHVSVFSRSIGNWERRHSPCDVIINATSIGTAENGSPINHLDDETRLVIDLAMKPGVLRDQCREKGIDYVGGLVFYRYQFKEQYKLYTGIIINDNDIIEAAEEYEKTFA